MKLKLGIPKGSLENATIDLFRRAGFADHHQQPLVLPRHRRSRNRMHADPRAGDGALRGRRHPRRRPHRPRLDRGERGRRRGRRRPDLRQAELRQGALGAGRARSLRLPHRARPGRQDHRHRTGGHHQALPGGARREGQGGIQLGRHRGEAAGAGRRHRGGHRDRLVAARQQAHDHRHRAGVEHAVDRQPAILGGPAEAAQAGRHPHAARRRHQRAGQGGADAQRPQGQPGGGAGRAARRSSGPPFRT